MNNKKYGLTLLIISILVITIGITYAYYMAQVQGTGNTNAETSARTATLGEVEFNGENTFDTTNIGRDIYPGFIGVQTFTVGPYKDGNGIYEIDLQASVPAAFGSDIKLTLYKTSDATNNNIDSEEGSLTITNNQYIKQDTLITNGTLTKVYEGALSTTTQEILEQVEFNIASNAFVTPDTTPDGEYTYYAIYEYLDNGNQNEQQGLNFSSKITVKYVLEKIKYAKDTILGLAGSADPTSTDVIDNGSDASGCTNTLAYDDYGNLRYVGANPCNYVTFNDETAGWRIIGVFDNQIKLIRNESIGSYSWDTSASNVNSGYGINQWGESGTYKGADLMKLLNPGYEENLAEDASGNAITGTYVNNSLYWNKQSGNCYNNQNNATTTCDFSSTGLTENAKTMIASTTWNLGSQGSNDVFTSGNGLGLASKFYELERSTNNGKICSSGKYCNDAVNRTTTWEGYIGLMSPSDYGYAVGGEVRNTCLNLNLTYGGYNTNNCYSNDWLYKTSTDQWTMSPDAISSNASYVFYVWNYVDRNDAAVAYAVRPALFLISDIEISGEGTPSSPFTLSLE